MSTDKKNKAIGNTTGVPGGPPWQNYYPPKKDYSERDAKTALDRTMIGLLFESVFFSTFISRCNVVYGNPPGGTACVSVTDRITITLNKDFWMAVPDAVRSGVLKHEIYHLVFDHISTGSNFPNRAQANVAADLVINQIIGKQNLPAYGWFHEDHKLLPNLTLEGYYEKIANLEDWDKRQQMENLIRKLQKGGLSEQEQKEIEEQIRQMGNDVSHHTIDHHGDWGEDEADGQGIPKELREALVKGVVKSVAQETQKDWGNLPAQLQAFLEALITPPNINWKRQISDSFRTILHDETELSKRRESKRFRSTLRFNPGTRKKRKATILFIVDTSGSMSDGELTQIGNEIYWCAKKTGSQVDLIFCDAECYSPYKDTKEPEPQPFDGRPIKKYKGRGGTDFRPPFKFVQKDKYDGVFYATDGCGPAPERPPRVPTTWILTNSGSEPCKWGRFIRLPKPDKNGRL